MTHFERGRGFVDLKVHGEALIRNWGRVGGATQQRVVRFASASLAEEALQKQARRLENKGYLAGRSDRAMIAAIQADPKRAASYLVYGDWLLAQEDPRGQLIATMSRGDEVEPLLKEHELQLRPKWMVATTTKLEWRLGFLQRVTMPAFDCWHVRRLLRHPSSIALEELVLEGRQWRTKADWAGVLATRPPTLTKIFGLEALG